jgi:uncharacterized repeat protein (TIGR01451 family)
MARRVLDKKGLQKIKSVIGLLVVFSILIFPALPAAIIFAEGEEPSPISNEPAPVVSEQSLETSAIQTSSESALESAPGEAIVVTGDASSSSETANEVNTNLISTGVGAETEPNSEMNPGVQSNQGTSTVLEISNNNEALASSTIIGTSLSGDNTASSTGTTTIVTGNAVASADLTNIVNTNIVNSEGAIIVESSSLESESLDIRSDMSVGSSGGGCSICTSSTTITNQNMATVTNFILLDASSGNNSASSTGASTIITGDAYAGANAVTVANTNIVDSNFFLLAFNNLGDWSGDIIFPNEEFFAQFLNNLLSQNCDCSTDIHISTTNTAELLNNISSTANSGENNANGGESTVITGNAVATSLVYNEVNQTAVNSSSFLLIIRVLGEWSGQIFNLPKGISWENSSEGIVLYSSDLIDSFSSNPVSSGNSGNNSSLSIRNENNAFVENNINVSANTGENSSLGIDSNAIYTGSAFSAVNTVSILNTNIVRSNWMRGFVNILGDWSGNVSFGQPDLSLESSYESDGPIDPGDTVTIYSKITNNGDATAHGINFEHVILDNNLRFIDEGNALKISKSISLLHPGETYEYSYKAQVSQDVPQGDNFLESKAGATADESEANYGDNSIVMKLPVYNHPIFISPLNLTSYTSTYPNISVTKTNNATSTITAGDSIDYTIVVKNSGGKAFEGVVHDELVGASDEVIKKQQWDLGTILDGEEVTITYTVVFSSSTLPGIYNNYAWVDALGGDYLNHYSHATSARSPISQSSVEVKGTPTPSQEDFALESVKAIPTGTLRTTPKTGEVLGEQVELVSDGTPSAPDNKFKFDFKNIAAALFSFILLVKPTRSKKGLTMML